MNPYILTYIHVKVNIMHQFFFFFFDAASLCNFDASENYIILIANGMR